MTKSERLEPVTRFSESKEREAARLLGLAQAAAREQERQLAELQGYLAEYQAAAVREHGGVQSAERLHDYQRFLSRLNEAIAQQQARVLDAQRECERRRQTWLAAHTHTRALGKVVDRYRAEERRAQGRAEQRELDERAQQRPRNGHERDE
jgi:flagellar FliJ protein